MATGTVVLSSSRTVQWGVPGQHIRVPSQPISIQSDWVTFCDAPAVADGTPVTAPNALTRTNLFWGQMRDAGTILRICLRYKNTATPTTAPKIQVFGRDANNVVEKLVDAANVHVITLAFVVATDADDGTYKYTDPVEVDIQGSVEALVAINTALAADDTALAQILGRMK